MTAVGASEALIGLIAANRDLANDAGGCDERTIVAAEEELGVALPPSYRRLVAQLGTWDIAGDEFLGVYRTAALDDSLLGSPAETLDARTEYGMPSELVVVMFDGMGGLIVLDSSTVGRGDEFPVLVWNPGIADRDDMERVGQDFGSFALGRCRRAVARWREFER